MREIDAILRGEGQRLLDSHERALALAHEQARLNSFAFHDPKHMPEFKPRKAPARVKIPEIASEADNARVRAYFIGMAMRTKH